MDELSLELIAGMRLRKLIKENYRTQQDFADDYGLDIRSVSRYINSGIPTFQIVQELADFFHVDRMIFMKLD